MGADPAAQEQFGPYLVYERLGIGGMATVHRAVERRSDGVERIVALKRLLPHLAADASFIKSFVREAKLASYLNHGNIVQLFELGRVGSAYFISMEYIDGRDIRRILRHARRVSGPPPIHVTVGLLLQLCDALDYAHHKMDDTGHPLGLVHRDVSPSNVLVNTTGQVKVIDFGIAKAQSAQLRTQTGRVKGKLAYMAPEALAGKEFDARSDLFAVGVIAHELLTAHPLFATKNEYETLMKLQRGAIAAPSSINPSCPAELDAIVLRALARDPDDRFSRASELRYALQAVRARHELQTSARDIATWIDWAFSLELPTTGSTGHRDPGGGLVDLRSRSRGRIKRSDDDELVEIAWGGGGDDQSSGQPILLDDVPDVSEKHLEKTHPSSLGAEVRLDLDDLADDIAIPVPSPLARPTPRPRPTDAPAATGVAPPSAPRSHPPTPPLPQRLGTGVPVALPARADRSPSLSAATRLPSGGTAAAVAGASLRSVVATPRARTITSAPRVVPVAMPATRTRPSLSPPPPGDAMAPSRMPSGSSAPRDRTASPAGRDPAQSQREREVEAAAAAAMASAAAAMASAAAAPPSEEPATDEVPALHLDDAETLSDTMPSLPAMRSSESVVRFRMPTAPPAPVSAPPGSSSVYAAASPAPPAPRPSIAAPAASSTAPSNAPPASSSAWSGLAPAADLVADPPTELQTALPTQLQTPLPPQPPTSRVTGSMGIPVAMLPQAPLPGPAAAPAGPAESDLARSARRGTTGLLEAHRGSPSLAPPGHTTGRTAATAGPRIRLRSFVLVLLALMIASSAATAAALHYLSRNSEPAAIGGTAPRQR